MCVEECYETLAEKLKTELCTVTFLNQEEEFLEVVNVRKSIDNEFVVDTRLEYFEESNEDEESEEDMKNAEDMSSEEMIESEIESEHEESEYEVSEHKESEHEENKYEEREENDEHEHEDSLGRL